MSEQDASEIRTTYRGLLLRGLAAGEAANVVAFLSGLPSAGVRWTIAEVEAIVGQRAEHIRRTELSLEDLAAAEPLIWQTS